MWQVVFLGKKLELDDTFKVFFFRAGESHSNPKTGLGNEPRASWIKGQGVPWSLLSNCRFLNAISMELRSLVWRPGLYQTSKKLCYSLLRMLGRVCPSSCRSQADSTYPWNLLESLDVTTGTYSQNWNGQVSQ